MIRFNFHSHHSQQQHSVRSYDVHENVSTEKFFTVGLHPWWIQELHLEEDINLLRDYLNNPHCVALGECGLDRLKGPSLEIQISVLIRQCELAAELRKPVVLHVVKCYPELQQVCSRFPEIQFILHGFTGNQHWADTFRQAGFFFSFGKHLRPMTSLAEVFKTIPLDRLFLETDDLAESALEKMYQNASSILGISEQNLGIILEENWKRFIKDNAAG